MIDQKRQRVRDSKNCLNLFNRNPSDFLRRFVIIDETWIHHYTPESKQQAKQWVRPGRTAPKRAKTQQSAGKVMASFFCDSSDTLFIDYLEKVSGVATIMGTPDNFSVGSRFSEKYDNIGYSNI